MSKRTWVPLLLVITALLLIVGCGGGTTEADIKKLEDRISELESDAQKVSSDVRKLWEEAEYVHACVYVRTLSHGSHAHEEDWSSDSVFPKTRSGYVQLEDIGSHGVCSFRDNYEDTSPFRKWMP